MQFKNLQDAVIYFKDEEFCRDYLGKLRWPDGVITCPKCGQRGAYRYCDGKFFKCKDQTCKNRFSVTVGTMYENSKIPLSKWFVAIWLISAHKKGISSCQIARDLGLGQKAGWFLLHRIRQMLEETAPAMLEEVVEVDECYVGGKWKNRSKAKRRERKESGDVSMDDKTPVIGMVQRGGRATLKVIGKNFDDQTLKEMIIENVNKEALVITDGHNGYTGLDKIFSGHEVVNHSANEYVRDGFFTNTVEGFFSHFKRMIIGTYHQISPAHLNRYCVEHSYRYNTRKLKDSQRFSNVLGQYAGRLKYKDLIMKK